MNAPWQPTSQAVALGGVTSSPLISKPILSISANTLQHTWIDKKMPSQILFCDADLHSFHLHLKDSLCTYGQRRDGRVLQAHLVGEALRGAGGGETQVTASID